MHNFLSAPDIIKSKSPLSEIKNNKKQSRDDKKEVTIGNCFDFSVFAKAPTHKTLDIAFAITQEQVHNRLYLHELRST